MRIRHDDNNPDGHDALQRLEAALRRFQPPVPSGLDERILASRPRRRTTPAPRRRLGPWALAGGLAAAAVVALLVLPHLWTTAPAPTTPRVAMTDDEIERTLQREAAAARLLTSTEILLAQPGGEALAGRTLDYIARVYGDTDAGRRITQHTCTSMGVTQ